MPAEGEKFWLAIPYEVSHDTSLSEEIVPKYQNLYNVHRGKED